MEMRINNSYRWKTKYGIITLKKMSDLHLQNAYQNTSKFLNTLKPIPTTFRNNVELKKLALEQELDRRGLLDEKNGIFNKHNIIFTGM